MAPDAADAADAAAAAAGLAAAAAALAALAAASAACWARRRRRRGADMARGGGGGDDDDGEDDGEEQQQRPAEEKQQQEEREMEPRVDVLAAEVGGVQALRPVNAASRRENVKSHVLCWGEVPFRTSAGDPADVREAPAPPTYVLEPTSALNAQSIRDVACYASRMLAVSNAGDVYESTPSGTDLQQVLAGERALAGVRVASVSCGPTFSLAVTSSPRGDVYSWGTGPHGELGHGPDRHRERFPRRVVGLLHEVVAQTACGERHVLARTRSGALFSWGWGGCGQLGHRRASTLSEEDPLTLNVPSKVQSIPMRTGAAKGRFRSRIIVHVAARADHSAILDSEGVVMCFGSTRHGQCGAEVSDRPVWAPQIVQVRRGADAAAAAARDPIVQVACGDACTAARTESGRVYMWGDNVEGELGRETTRPFDHEPGPVRLRDLAGRADDSVRASWIALGGHHGAAVLRGDGQVVCWGRRTSTRVPAVEIRVRQAGPPHAAAIPEDAAGQADAHGDVVGPLISRRTSRERTRPSAGLRMVACGDTYCVYVENLRNDVDLTAASPYPEETIETQQPKLLPEALAQQLAHESAETVRRGRWKEKVFKDWKRQREKKRTRVMWMAGIPMPLRATAWPLAVGNAMHITKPLYFAFKASAKQQFIFTDSLPAHSTNAYNPEATETEVDSDYKKRLDMPRETCELIDADLPRTFPSLRMFAQSGPLGRRLRNVLKAFAHYRPDIGYVQGMSYLAAVVCLNTANEYLAFQTLANLLLKEHLFAFYRLDQALIFEYYEIYERALEAHDETSRVAAHLGEIGAHPHLYLYNWLQTLFFKVLPIDLASRVMDCFLWEGTAFCIRAAVAVVALFRDVLRDAPFETCIKLLSCSPGQEFLWDTLVVKRADHFFTVIDDVRLSKDLLAALHELNARVFY